MYPLPLRPLVCLVWSLAAALLAGSSPWAVAQEHFDFKSSPGCAALEGSNSFALSLGTGINPLGTLPVGLVDVEIILNPTAPEDDLDFQVFDMSNGEPLIHPSLGLLRGSELQSGNYADMILAWSGTQGDGVAPGRETLAIVGAITRPLAVRVASPTPASVQVDYRWRDRIGVDGTPCGDRGGYSVTHAVVEGDQLPVAQLPAGLTDVYVELRAAGDMDLQLQTIDPQTPLVDWLAGPLAGPGPQTLDAEGLTIQWSGYNGIDDHPGHESLHLQGTLADPLTLGVYGYHRGLAVVHYAWGYDTGAPVYNILIGGGPGNQTLDIQGSLPNLCWAVGQASFQRLDDLLLVYIPITAAPAAGDACLQQLRSYSFDYTNTQDTPIRRVYVAGQTFQCPSTDDGALGNCTLP